MSTDPALMTWLLVTQSTESNKYYEQNKTYCDRGISSIQPVRKTKSNLKILNKVNIEIKADFFKQFQRGNTNFSKINAAKPKRNESPF